MKVRANGAPSREDVVSLVSTQSNSRLMSAFRPVQPKAASPLLTPFLRLVGVAQSLVPATVLLPAIVATAAP